MSVATVVSRGYGSFGSVNFVPTFGYTIGAAVDQFVYSVDRSSCSFAQSRSTKSEADKRSAKSVARGRTAASFAGDRNG